MAAQEEKSNIKLTPLEKEEVIRLWMITMSENERGNIDSRFLKGELFVQSFSIRTRVPLIIALYCFCISGPKHVDI